VCSRAGGKGCVCVSFILSSAQYDMGDCSGREQVTHVLFVIVYGLMMWDCQLLCDVCACSHVAGWSMITGN
jgi:hypothetical protein